jgi:hypothetical protein
MNQCAVLPVALFLLSSVTTRAPVAPQTKSPTDKPVSTNAEQVKKFEDAIAPYVKKAQETLPKAKKRYLRGLPKNQIFYVTIKLYDLAKKYELVFVKVTSWKRETIEGILDSDVTLIPNHPKGEKLTCQESEVQDWTISKPDGSEEGNYVGKFLDTYKP